jgi:trans-aconitate methyltransferase
MNFGTDVKRVAYVLKPGETQPPKSIRDAFTKAVAARDVIKPAIKPGRTAKETMAAMDAALTSAYPTEVDGAVLFPFRRLFITLTR